jgi:hypothetical protein
VPLEGIRKSNKNQPGFDVRKIIKRSRVLILSLFILMSFCLVYLQYASLGEIHFISAELGLEKFKNMDQGDVVTDPPEQSKGIVSSSFVNLSHLGVHPLQYFVPFPPQVPFLDKKTFILRC